MIVYLMHVTPRKFEDLFIESSKSRKQDSLFKSVLSPNAHIHTPGLCVYLAFNMLVNVMMMYFEMSLRPMRHQHFANCLVQLFYMKIKTVL